MKTETKICKKCGEERPLFRFKKDDAYVGGYRPVCYECLNARAKELKAVRDSMAERKIISKGISINEGKTHMEFPEEPEFMKNKYWTVTKTDYRRPLKGL